MKLLKDKKSLYVNRETGEAVKINKTSAEKLTSGKAIGKTVRNGFTVAQHFEAVKKIDSLYKRASYVKTDFDTHGRKGVEFKKYEASLGLKGGEKSRAFITVMKTEQAGGIIYSVELFK